MKSERSPDSSVSGVGVCLRRDPRRECVVCRTSDRLHCCRATGRPQKRATRGGPPDRLRPPKGDRYGVKGQTQVAKRSRHQPAGLAGYAKEDCKYFVPGRFSVRRSVSLYLHGLL